METRPLGQTGISLSAIGLGSNYVGGHNLYEDVDEAELPRPRNAGRRGRRRAHGVSRLA